MPQKIGSRSFVDFEHNEVSITVKSSLLNLCMSLAIVVIFGGILLYQFEFDFSFTKRTDYFLLLFFFLPLIEVVRCLLYWEETQMNMTTGTLVRKKIFAGFLIRSIYAKWPKDAYFKYENVYDSYKRITAIWLVAASKEKNESKRLVRFLHKDNFLHFRNLFNEEFPEHPILEWHD